MADAWHHRSDALSSIGSFAGILGARMGFPVLDPIASLVICLFIVKAAVDVFRDAVSRMTDTSCGDDTVEEVRRAASDTEGVLGVDLVRTRLFGDRIYVDIEIEADRNLSLFDAHAVAERVHDAVEGTVPDVYKRQPSRTSGLSRKVPLGTPPTACWRKALYRNCPASCKRWSAGSIMKGSVPRRSEKPLAFRPPPSGQGCAPLCA